MNSSAADSFPVPRITHIAGDSQFLGFISRLFEGIAPGSNEFIVRSESGTLRFPVIAGRVQIVRPGALGLAQACRSARSSDIVIVHHMGMHGAAAFVTAPRLAMKVWSGWGGDYYGTDASRDDGLLGPRTAAALASTSRSHRTLGRAKGRIRGLVSQSAAGRADLFSAPVPEDFPLFQVRFPKFRGAYSQLNYASLEDSFLTASESINGNDIWIGNSASYANNHLDVFELIAQQGVLDRNIVVPLSYGDSKQYGRVVLAAGRAYFGKRFRPLVDFLPLEDYLAEINRCDVVMMGHKRQQALGNIGAALYQGAHVYLDAENPVAAFLENRGGIFRTLDELRANRVVSGALTGSKVSQNRRLVSEFWGRQRVEENVLELISRWQESSGGTR